MEFSREYEELNQDLTTDLEDDIDYIERDYLLVELLRDEVFTQYTDNVVVNINKMISAVEPAWLRAEKKLDELKDDLKDVYAQMDSAYEDDDEVLADVIFQEGLEDLEQKHEDIISALGRQWEFNDYHDFISRLRNWKEEMEKGAELVEDELKEKKKIIFKNKENIVRKVFGEDADWRS
jgi:peptidoglycan hydrolase CwlO-like protein